MNDFVKKNKWLILGGVAVLGYLWWKKNNKPTLKQEVESAEKSVEQAVEEVSEEVKKAV
jgi:hypothetical protein